MSKYGSIDELKDRSYDRGWDDALDSVWEHVQGAEDQKLTVASMRSLIAALKVNFKGAIPWDDAQQRISEIEQEMMSNGQENQ